MGNEPNRYNGYFPVLAFQKEPKTFIFFLYNSQIGIYKHSNSITSVIVLSSIVFDLCIIITAEKDFYLSIIYRNEYKKNFKKKIISLVSEKHSWP